MCGIVGFTGKNEAAPILLDGLSKLEYRGYDSAGIAVRNGDAEAEIVKAKGKLKVLKEMTNDGKAVKGSCGIGIHAGQRMVNHLLQTLTRIAVTTKMLLQYITALSRTIRNFVRNWSKRAILSSRRLIQKWQLS